MTEAIPPNAPDPRGKAVDLRTWVDSDHAGDKLQEDHAQDIFHILEYCTDQLANQEASDN